MLKRSNCIKRITASSGGDLQADSGESFLIRRIECVPSTNDTYLTLYVDRVTVGYYRVKGKSGNHLGTIKHAYLRQNLMDYLTSRGINVAIPVAEGQVFSVSRYAETGNVMIVYDIYDAGDMTAIMPNGSESKEFTFVQYMNVGTALSASGDALFDTSLSPAEFPNFPAGAVVPARHTIELLGLVGCPWNDAEAGPAGFATQFIKLIKDREVLFDEDRNGIPFNDEDAAATAVDYKSAFSMIGPCTEILLDTNVIATGEPLIFEPALEFVAGEELLVYVTCLMTGAPTWTTTVPDLAAILKATKE